MKKNGFTLVELLGVVTILVMLGLIIIPTINKVVSDNKVKLYNVQIKNIKSGASSFVSENVLSFDVPNNGSIGIKLGKLKELGYVDNNITNPITREQFDDNLVIIITNSSNVYEYTVCDDTVDDVYCDSNVTIYGE